MAKKRSSFSQIVAFMSEQEQERVKAKMEGEILLALDAIRPDPEQPRRLFPADISDALVRDELSPTDALQEWLGRGDGEFGENALKRHVRELRRLAESIAQNGLIQPITVRIIAEDEQPPPGVTHLIITGERRYWAHVLLAIDGRMIQEGFTERDPRYIRVIIPDAGISIRAHQLLENIMRENIDAIEKAEGIVALRQELTRLGNHGSPGKTVSWRVVNERLGISDRYRKYILAVLNLSEEAQQLIENYGFTERMVRPLTQKLRRYPQLQLTALRQLIQWQEENEQGDGPERPLVSSIKAYVDELLALEQDRNHGSPLSKAPKAVPPTLPQFHRKVKGALNYLNKLRDSDWLSLTAALNTEGQNEAVVQDLQELRRQLDALLQAGESNDN